MSWEAPLIAALCEAVSFLQLTLWGRVCGRGKANIDSATAWLWGVARLGDKWSGTGGFMHLCINVIPIVWLERIIFSVSGLV